MGVENFYIEKGSAESSSVIFSDRSFVVKAFAIQRLKYWLSKTLIERSRWFSFIMS